MKNIFLRARWFYGIGLCIFLLFLSYGFPNLFFWAKLALGLYLGLSIADYLFLAFTNKNLEVNRKVYETLSLGDEQKVNYEIINKVAWPCRIEIYDEFPFQLQERNFKKKLLLKAQSNTNYSYHLRPLRRGIYAFGNIHLYRSNIFPGLVEKRKLIECPEEVAVVPSVIQMKKFQLQVFAKTATMTGIRKIRKVGENDEFEHIQAYYQGDPIRSINWKATSRKNQLMVNKYQNSRSQMVYSIIDKGRVMKMPFDGLTLLDHSINSALVISNIVLRKFDKAGLITFGNKIGAVVKAEASQRQLEKINKSLYAQKTDFLESNYELLFYQMRALLRRRSILFFYTNFEHMVDLERSLNYLKSLNNKHLLVVITFINTELSDSAEAQSLTKEDIYKKTTAQKILVDKEKIVDALRANNIQTIHTRPQDLNINVINKYLEIKAKRLF